MYENYRDSFGRDDHRRRDRNREGARYDRNGADYGAQGERDWREHNRARREWQDSDERHRDDHHRYGQGASRTPYGGYGYADTYDSGDSRYFTGQQGSYAVSPYSRGSYGAGGYGGGGAGYGEDYRRHSYSNPDDHERGFLQRAGDEVASWFGDEDAARRREQDHRGRGPKDYVRSDERIREDANDRLTEDSWVDASSITVTVQQGEVTLDGTVPARQSKRRAEDIVENISGVKHVQNNLRVAEAAKSAGLESNWTLNETSTAEGGTLSRPIGSASKQSEQA